MFVHKLNAGQSVKGSKDGSVILIVGFESFLDVATFLKDYESGALTEHFRPIQDAVRRFPGYEDYTFSVNITPRDYLCFLMELGKKRRKFSRFSDFGF